jgi:hypothetical protein
VVEPNPAIRDYSTWYGLQDILLRICLGEVSSKYFVPPHELLQKVRTFLDANGFLRRETFTRIVNPETVVFKSEYFEDISDMAPGSIDFLSSRSTLEHVSDYESCFDKLEMVMKKGGVMYHDIGFGSHTLIDSFLMYYIDKSEKEFKDVLGLNELRLCDFIEEFNKRRFRCYVVRKDILSNYHLDKNVLKERFCHYSNEDLLCEGATIICKKI